MLSMRENSDDTASISQTEHDVAQDVDAVELSEILRRARRNRGVSQRKLAKTLRVSASAVAQWELGQSKPTILNRVDLAQSLGVPFSELLPEATTGETLVISNPRSIAMLRQFERLPRARQEDALMLVAGLAERYSKRAAPDTSDQPEDPPPEPPEC